MKNLMKKKTNRNENQYNMLYNDVKRKYNKIKIIKSYKKYINYKNI